MVKNLKALREAKGMTQAELAKTAKINRITISKYERGKVSPSLDNAARIAKALGISLNELVEMRS